MDKDVWQRELVNLIGSEREAHSLSVSCTALKLAKIAGEDLNKTAVAAYLHDCGKLKNNKLIFDTIRGYDIILDQTTKQNIQLQHAVLGRYMAQDRFRISDVDILNAIRYHTTGRENMSMLEKIVFVADGIDAGRHYDGVEKIREVAFEDLERGLICLLEHTLNYLKRNNNQIHANTVKALAWYKKRRRL